MFQWRIGVRLVAAPAGRPADADPRASPSCLGDIPEPVDVVPFVTAQVIGLLVNLVLINIWEETAWSGIVQTRLEQRYGLVKAALLTAVPFALIHLPLHFIGDFTIGSVIGALVTLLLICAVVRLMLGVVLRGTRGSILAVAVLHTMFNRSNNDEGHRGRTRRRRRPQAGRPARGHRAHHAVPSRVPGPPAAADTGADAVMRHQSSALPRTAPDPDSNVDQRPRGIMARTTTGSPREDPRR